MSYSLDRIPARAGGAADALRSARQRASGEIDGIVGLALDARGAIGDLQNVLSDMLARTGADGGGKEPLAAIGEELGGLVDGLGQLAAQLGGERMNTTCTDIRSLTRDIVRSGLEFQMVAKLTAITVASLPSRSPELETYAEAFGDITQRLSAVSLDVEAQLGRIVTARGGAIEDFSAAWTDLRRLRDTLGHERDGDRTTRGRDAGAALAAAAGAFQSRAGAEFGNLSDATTLSDRFADRADHVATALQLAQSAPPPRASALRAVAVALADDLVAATRSMAATLHTSVARLADDGASVNGVFETWRGNGDLEASMTDRARGLSRASEQLTEAGPRIDAIAARASEIEAMGAEASKSLNDLVNISRAIMVSAVNAGLIASRISSSGGPLTVLAAAAQSQALNCSRRIEDCSAAVTVLIGTMEGLGLEGIRLDLDAVTGTAERLGSAEDGGSGRGLDAVAPRIAASVGVFARVGADLTRRQSGLDAAMAAIEAAVEPLRGDAGPLDVDPKALADLRAIYTTSAERDIHDRVVGAAARAAASFEGALA